MSSQRANTQKKTTAKVESVQAPSITYDRNEDIKTVFQIFDKDGNGRISKEEVGCLLKSLGRDFAEEDIKKLIAETDKDNNGTIELAEFIAYMDVVSVKPLSQLEEVVEAFKIFDIDNNGWITCDEFKSILMNFGGDFTEREVEEIFRESDLNNDGKLAYAEFIEIWKYQ